MIRDIISSLKSAIASDNVAYDERIARVQFEDGSRAIIEFECKDMQLVKVYGTDMSFVNGGFRAFEHEDSIYRGISISTVLTLFDTSNLKISEYLIVKC